MFSAAFINLFFLLSFSCTYVVLTDILIDLFCDHFIISSSSSSDSSSSGGGGGGGGSSSSSSSSSRGL